MVVPRIEARGVEEVVAHHHLLVVVVLEMKAENQEHEREKEKEEEEAEPVEEEQEEMKKTLEIALNFMKKRQRPWSVLIFHPLEKTKK